MPVAQAMIKDPLVKQRSQAPPVTVAVTVASWHRAGGQRGSLGDTELIGSSLSELSCLSAMSVRFKHVYLLADDNRLNPLRLLNVRLCCRDSEIEMHFKCHFIGMHQGLHYIQSKTLMLSSGWKWINSVSHCFSYFWLGAHISFGLLTCTCRINLHRCKLKIYSAHISQSIGSILKIQKLKHLEILCFQMLLTNSI